MSDFNWVTKACCVILLWTAAAVVLPAQTYTTLHRFNGTDGFSPFAGLVLAANGSFYGTTSGGGASGHGTVFRIATSGSFTTLDSFDGTDGGDPSARLVQSTNGNLYGTTLNSGANGDGGVFKITSSGALTMLYSFCSQGNCADGANPYAGLAQGTDGKFYGTTIDGGVDGSCMLNGLNGCGTVFKITPSGVLTTLHRFGSSDGGTPDSALVQGTNGNFYGTTYGGGAFAYGTVFKITPGGTLTTLHGFCPRGVSCPDGANPFAGLIQATDGDFYGTTASGGAYDRGTVFRITPSGTLTTLYSFCAAGGGCTDGAYPYAGLIQATDGNFYGTTYLGGAYDRGTVFTITPSGTLTILYNFCPAGGSCTDGASPWAELVQDTDGNFYGTTLYGGTREGSGTVFRLSTGLAPFVETQPTSGTTGAAIEILGTSLAGATSVTFNGAAAAFVVVSSSEITTTVPTGTTSGAIQVVTPTGPLSSNVTFTVRP